MASNAAGSADQTADDVIPINKVVAMRSAVTRMLHPSLDQGPSGKQLGPCLLLALVEF